MCSVFGWVGLDGELDEDTFKELRLRAGDRGRDGGNVTVHRLKNGMVCLLGAWRATPTTEVKDAPVQPYDGIVHNGTIANDKELGNKEGAVDSMVLPQVLDRGSLKAFTRTVKMLKGSYAIVAVSEETGRVYAAVNYKPLYTCTTPTGVYFSSMERHLAHIRWPAEQVDPYSTRDLLSGDSHSLWPEENPRPRALVIASSGLDSTTAAYVLRAKGMTVDLLHFIYGAQATERESGRITAIAAKMNSKLIIERIGSAGFVSPLTSTDKRYSSITEGVRGAEYAHEWVPARNLVMLAHATAIAESHGYRYIALGNNLEEAGAYPDNEEQFTYLFNKVLPYATQNGVRVECIWPVGHLMKHEIVKLGLQMGVPYELTWSCYRGTIQHCGKCGPCFMRRTAFERNGVKDPVPYL